MDTNRPAPSPRPSTAWITLRAIGRSYSAPAFGRSAGDKLTTTLPGGKRNPDDFTADRTRSRDSLTAASGNPTIRNCPRPPLRVVSMRTGRGSTPTRAHEVTNLFIYPTYVATVTRRVAVGGERAKHALLRRYSTSLTGFPSILADHVVVSFAPPG